MGVVEQARLVADVALEVGCSVVEEGGKITHAVALVIVFYFTQQSIAPIVQHTTHSACAVVVVEHRLSQRELTQCAQLVLRYCNLLPCWCNLRLLEPSRQR